MMNCDTKAMGDWLAAGARSAPDAKDMVGSIVRSTCRLWDIVIAKSAYLCWPCILKSWVDATYGSRSAWWM